jgi:hypothetical protein
MFFPGFLGFFNGFNFHIGGGGGGGGGGANANN